jgi:hypothetical protein
MTRLLGWAFLTVVVLLLLGLTALVLLGTSPGWLAQSRHGEQAYEVLVVLAALGLRGRCSSGRRCSLDRLGFGDGRQRPAGPPDEVLHADANLIVRSAG